MIPETLNALEYPLKRALFDCQNCGSCLLSQTHLVCPMNCPKGLRNGPCGGTLDGKCEVYEDQPCVWMRIRHQESDSQKPSIHAPMDETLLGSSSYFNWLTGSDKKSRLPIVPQFIANPQDTLQTKSLLEKTLSAGDFVFTTEIRSPSDESGWDRVRNQIRELTPWIHAFNTTSSHGGRQTLSSIHTAREVLKLGAEPILQICGRDVDPLNFLTQVECAWNEGITNLLCLTGDWPVHEAKLPLQAPASHQRFFPMDSSQMIYELRHLREKSESAFTSIHPVLIPKMFIGTAANPFSTPMEISVQRLAQKAAVGADFVQTQLVFDTKTFIQWAKLVEAQPSMSHLKLLVSIPIIGSQKSLQVLKNLRGIHVPDTIYEKLGTCQDISSAGLDLATSIMEELSKLKIVAGFHLTHFGIKAAAIGELVAHFKKGQPASSQPLHQIAA